MTRIAYLMLVHHQPKQTALLVRALADANSFMFIHVDATSDKSLFEEALQKEACDANVIFLDDRIQGLWGHYSLVEATLRLLKKAMAQPTPFDHFILLSGQDFPVKSNASIGRFLSAHRGYDFIEHFSLPSDKLCEKQGGLYRVNRFHQITTTKHTEFPPYSKKPLLYGVFNAWANFHHKAIRKMPFNMQPYGGSQWWILSRNSVAAILKFLEEHPAVALFFQNVWIPDELFFQTVLLHLKGNDPCVVNKNYRFTEWKPKGRSLFAQMPTTFMKQDFEKLQNTDALFARKFDENLSLEVVQQLGKMRSEADASLREQER